MQRLGNKRKTVVEHCGRISYIGANVGAVYAIAVNIVIECQILIPRLVLDMLLLSTL